MGSSPDRGDQTCVPCIGRRILYHWTTREAPSLPFLTKPFFWSSKHTCRMGLVFQNICSAVWKIPLKDFHSNAFFCIAAIWPRAHIPCSQVFTALFMSVWKYCHENHTAYWLVCLFMVFSKDLWKYCWVRGSVSWSLRACPLESEVPSCSVSTVYEPCDLGIINVWLLCGSVLSASKWG